MPSGMAADAVNLAYVHELFERYLADASGVPAEWQAYFASRGEELAAALPLVRRLQALYPGLFGEQGSANTPGEADADGLRDETAHLASDASRSVASAIALVEAYRRHGHLAARLDPLGSEPIGDPRWTRPS